MSDFFKDHEITYQIEHTHQDNRDNDVALEIVHFRSKEYDTMYALEFQLHRGRHLLVTGDYGYAVYSWSDPHNLYWIANTDFGYFHSKCKASSYGEKFLQWDGDIGKERIEIYAENKDDWSPSKKNKFLKYASEQIKYRRTWIWWLHQFGDKFFDSVEMERMSDVGYIPHEWSRIQHDALKAAFNLV